MRIQLDAQGEIIGDIDDGGDTVSYTQGEGTTTTPSTIGDPNAPQDYSDEELAAALPFTQGVGSPEQIEIDGMRAREKFCLDKANEVSGYQADGTPIYVRGELDRAQLLRQAKGIRDSLPLQLLMSERNIARRYLDGQKQTADAQALLARYAALEARAHDIAFEDQAKELAALMIKRKLGGQRT
jgi:hypothetical protein